MDIAKFDTRKIAEKGYDLVIVDVNGAKTDIVITVRGSDSEVYQKALREQQRKRRQQFNKNPRRGILQTPEQDEEDALDLAVAATVGWIGIEKDGADCPYNEKNARELYKDYPAIREQVEQAIADRVNFLPSTATT